MTQLTTPEVKPVPVSPRQRGALVRKVLSNPLGLFGVVTIVVVLVIAVLAPVIAPNDPNFLRLDMVNASPGGDFLLGGDGAGRDILSRLIHGARNTLAGAAIAVSVAMALGVTSGLIGGYFGRKLDATFSWIAEILMALPAMIVLLAIFQAVGSNILLAMAAFGVMMAPGFYRLVRGQVMGVKNELYVDAARVSGLTDWRILGRHVLLVVRAPVIIQASIVSGIGIIMQSGLEFLGLGNPAIPTWGGILQNAFQNIFTAPLAIIWPGLTIGITVAAFVLLGNAVRDAIQRTSSQKSVRRPAAGNLAAERDETHARHSATLTDAGNVLEIRGLTVGYPADPGDGDGWTRVVKSIDLDVRRGEILGLVGESGSGKTQTAFSVLGLLPAGGALLDDSSIVFEGRQLVGLAEPEYEKLRGREIAYVPQEPMSNLDPCFRVGYQLVQPLRKLGMTKAEAEKEALELLGRVGIPDPRRTFNAYPHEISGGMAQRVLIAGAISARPKLLIADEPTTALDVTVQAEVLDLLRDLQAEIGMSVLMVTHNFGVVADLCHRVAVMQLGEIVEVDDVETIFASPQHPYTRMLLDSTLEGSDVRTYQSPRSTR